MIKNNKGVTLISLVVTIIVLLILAAVSLNFVLNGSLLDKASDAKFRTEVAAILEKWNMERAAKEMKGVPDKDMNYTLKDALKGVYDVSDKYNKKLKIENGDMVFNPSECTAEEKHSLEILQIYAQK